ncbi:HCL512Wp [Eremothecium sinecaudum]|uniref:HCL512Wp n=1 Tax=Eremothecium sinecaudum TaxID=45286 RepID=A0A120K1Q7_9SACH|nr:HCL512Wp [Eremothecium sinecaudum]AMD19639.1 HCL512Wp [Eremothecium sinecaudum]
MSNSAEIPLTTDDPTGILPNTKIGRKNHAITKPITVDAETAEVLVRKPTGKPRLRKGQSEENYQEQLVEFFENSRGPLRTEEGWMDALDIDNTFDITIKQERQKLTAYCQRLYFRGEYAASYAMAMKLLPKYESINHKNKLEREISELQYIMTRSKPHI